MGTVKENFLRLKQEIKDIAPYTPNIVAVTKYFDETKLIEAYEAGLRDFGESRVVDAIKKINALPKEIRETSNFHLIGHLQTNKAKKAVENFDLIHSVDSLKLANAISDEAVKKEKKQKVLIQVNNAGEEQKTGFSSEEIYKVFNELKDLKGLEIIGLMNMAPFGLEERELRELFFDIRKLRDELEKEFGCELKELSMGMSGDYKPAIEAGATMIRIGQKLFK
jgi:hypothetical protein